MPRRRDWRRWQRDRAIGKKAGFLRRAYGPAGVLAWTAGGTKVGRLSKGKIHCSCWMCRSKLYDSPSHADARMRSGLQEQLRCLVWTESSANRD